MSEIIKTNIPDIEQHLINIKAEVQNDIQMGMNLVASKLSSAEEVVRQAGRAGVDHKQEMELTIVNSADGSTTVSIKGSQMTQKEPTRGWFG